jgi:hypothetical protein
MEMTELQVSERLRENSIDRVSYNVVGGGPVEGIIELNLNGRKLKQAKLYYKNKLIYKRGPYPNEDGHTILVWTDQDSPKLREAASKTFLPIIGNDLELTVEFAHDRELKMPTVVFNGTPLTDSYKESKWLTNHEKLSNMMYYEKGSVGFILGSWMTREEIERQHPGLVV